MPSACCLAPGSLSVFPDADSFTSDPNVQRRPRATRSPGCPLRGLPLPYPLGQPPAHLEEAAVREGLARRTRATVGVLGELLEGEKCPIRVAPRGLSDGWSAYGWPLGCHRCDRKLTCIASRAPARFFTIYFHAEERHAFLPFVVNVASLPAGWAGGQSTSPRRHPLAI